MRFRHIRRHHTYQHAALDIPIHGNVIAIVGPNGSGKSNLLKSMGEVITGKYAVDKSRIPSRGSTESFMHDTIALSDGREMSIKREFPSGDSTLEVTGEKKVVKPAKVNARILELLGVDENVLENIVFVGQEDISSILFARAGIKDRLAQTFFGLERANIIEAALGKRNGVVSYNSAGGEFEAVTALHREATTSLIDVNDRLAAMGEPVSADTLSKLDREFATTSEQQTQRRGYVVMLEEIERASRDYDEIKATHEKDSVSLANIDIAKLNGLLQTALDHQAENSTIRRLDSAIASSQSMLDQLGAAPHQASEVESLEARVIELGIEEGRLLESRKSITGILAGISTKPTCPTCGQHVDISRRKPLEDDLLKVETDLKNLIARRNPVLVERDTKKRALTNWSRQHDTIGGGLQQAKAERAKFGQLHQPEPDPNKFLQMKSGYDTIAARVDQQRHRLQEIHEARTVVDASRARLEQIVMGPDGKLIPEVDLEPLRLDLERARTSFQNRSSLLAVKSSLEARLSGLDERVANAKAAKTENLIQDRFRGSLAALRNVFHPDGAPRTVVTRNAKSMEDAINHHLGQLNSKFFVKAKDGLNFTCVFPDGEALDSELSVGQKVALAWAFRFAACETFSSSVGLMTLDEPTATLDAAVKENFNAMAERLKELAVKHGMQFFISTHDTELARHCDQIIDLTPQG